MHGPHLFIGGWRFLINPTNPPGSATGLPMGFPKFPSRTLVFKKSCFGLTIN
jgi:hypothetical protein